MTLFEIVEIPAEKLISRTTPVPEERRPPPSTRSNATTGTASFGDKRGVRIHTRSNGSSRQGPLIISDDEDFAADSGFRVRSRGQANSRRDAALEEKNERKVASVEAFEAAI